MDYERRSDDRYDRHNHGKCPDEGWYAAWFAPVLEQVVAFGAPSTASASVAGKTGGNATSIAAARATEACLFAWARQPYRGVHKADDKAGHCKWSS